MSAIDMSAQAMKRQRQMFQLLDDHFDADKGMFATGWDDARIARETGLAESHIVKTREAAYGPIKLSPEVMKLQADLSQTRAKARQDVEQLRQLLAQMQEEHERKITTLEVRMDALVKAAAA